MWQALANWDLAESVWCHKKEFPLFYLKVVSKFFPSQSGFYLSSKRALHHMSEPRHYLWLLRLTWITPLHELNANFLNNTVSPGQCSVFSSILSCLSILNLCPFLLNFLSIKVILKHYHFFKTFSKWDIDSQTDFILYKQRSYRLVNMMSISGKI